MLGRIRDEERFNRLYAELSFVVADDEVEVQSSATGFNIVARFPFLNQSGTILLESVSFAEVYRGKNVFAI